MIDERARTKPPWYENEFTIQGINEAHMEQQGLLLSTLLEVTRLTGVSISLKILFNPSHCSSNICLLILRHDFSPTGMGTERLGIQRERERYSRLQVSRRPRQLTSTKRED